MIDDVSAAGGHSAHKSSLPGGGIRSRVGMPDSEKAKSPDF